MEKYISKTLANVKNETGDSRGILVNLPETPVLGNSDSIQTPTYIDAVLGVDIPNVNSSIMNLTNISVLPINTIIVNSDGISPQGLGQQLRITFTGTYEPFGVVDPKIVIYETKIAGVPVKLKKGATTLEITEEFFKSCSNMVQNSLYFSKAIMGDLENPHSVIVDLITPNTVIPENQQIGPKLTVEFEEVSPAKLGYGLWDLIGSETKTFGSVEQEFYYFKRIA